MNIFLAASPGEWTASIATLLGAVGAFVTAMYSLKVSKDSQGKIDTVHEIVNGQQQKDAERNTELVQTLQSHDVSIPPKKD